MDPKFLRELDYLFDHRPGVFRNSAVILVARIVCIALSVICFVLAMGFLFPDFGDLFMERFLRARTSESGANELTTPLGIMLLILSVVFEVAAYLCRLVIRRNVFVMNLVVWHDEYKMAQREKEFGSKWTGTEKQQGRKEQRR